MLVLQGPVASGLLELADSAWFPIAHGSAAFSRDDQEAAALRDLTHKHFASWLQAHAGASGTQRRRLVVLVRGGTAGGSGDDSSAAADVTQPAAKQSGANEAAVATGGTARQHVKHGGAARAAAGPAGAIASHGTLRHRHHHHTHHAHQHQHQAAAEQRQVPDSRTDDHDDSDGWETESDTEDHDGLGVAATESCDAQTAGFAADQVAIGNVALWRSSMPSIRGFYWHAQAAAKPSGKGKPARKQGRKRH